MHHIFAQVLSGSRWLMEPRAFRDMIHRAEAATPEAIQAAVSAYGQRQIGPTLIGDVAVIDMCGPITYEPTWFSMYFGGATVKGMQLQLRMALADPAVRAIVLRCSSSGGVVDMIPEFADEIFAVRGKKPIVAVADLVIASAAYWLASQVDTIYATRSSQLGSIGVYCEHDDVSSMLEKIGVKITLIAHGDHKVDGNAYEPLSDAVKADIQQSVDEVGAEFEAAVARGRGVSTKVVLDTFGQGKVFRGKQAIKLGLADKNATIDDVLMKLTKGRAGSVSMGQMDGAAGTLPIEASGKKKADDTVEPCDCSPECPCMDDPQEPCPSDCPTCQKDCACQKGADAKAAHIAQQQAQAVLNDEQAIITARR